MRKLILALFVFVMAAGWMSCKQQKEETLPNIIYIFPDQYRNYSLGFWSQPGNAKYLQGSPDPVSTSALDKLANEGVVFNRAVSNFPLCSPYRGMLLTGMYPDQNGLTTNCRNDRDVQLKTDAVCITDVFAQAGYNVSYFGKCHWQKTEPLFDTNGTYMGSTDAPGGYYINSYDTYVPPGPDRHSIDYFFQALKDDHFNPRVYSNDQEAIEGKADGELYMPGRFSSELESEKIIDYLSNTHGQRDPEKPFLMIWSLNPPHNPWTEKSTRMEFFDQYTESGKVNLEELLTHENADTAVGKYAPYYFANVSAVDYFIGKVLDHLDELGLTENTIIVFSSDHGEMLGSHGMQGKNIPEIEAFNIPFIIKWGDRLAHRVEDLILNVPDIMPTLLGLAEMEDKIPVEVQGKNYAGILKDPDAVPMDKPGSALFINLKSRGVYTGKYMFVVTENTGILTEVYCYDNEKDPYQMNKIPYEDLDTQTGEQLKMELTELLKNTNDKWYQEKICSDFLSY
jgi:arylsulfatase A-like enzyme